MAYQTVLTKPFNSHLRGLQRQGHQKAVQKAYAAMAEAHLKGEISLPRTRHGETRLSEVEKYDLGDGFRLVVQLVDGKEKKRAFLFAGTHDESDRWLDAHRNYTWVKNEKDGTLDFVQVTERAPERAFAIATPLNLDMPEELLERPLLSVLSEEEWTTIGLSGTAREFASKITGSAFERDGTGVLERLDQLTNYVAAGVVVDLLHHAHSGEWSQVHRRLEVTSGTVKVADKAEVAVAMTAVVNSEQFIRVWFSC